MPGAIYGHHGHARFQNVSPVRWDGTKRPRPGGLTKEAPGPSTPNKEQARGVFWCVIITAAQLYTSPNITWCVVIIIAAAQLYLQRGQLGNCVGIQANPGTRHEARIQYPGHRRVAGINKKNEGRWFLCDCHVLDKTHLGCKNDAHRARLPDDEQARFLD